MIGADDAEPITPARLPKIRDDIARYTYRWSRGGFPLPAGRVDSTESRHAYEVRMHEFGITAGHLRVGELYWVTRDMTALAVSAGRTIPEVHMRDRPAPAGLIVFDDAIGAIGYANVDLPEVPIDAISWGPYAEPGHAGGGLLVSAYVKRQRMIDSLTSSGLRLRTEVPPLTPAESIPIRASHLDPIPGERIDEAFGRLATVVRTLYAAWQLLAQPTIAENQRAQVDKQVAARYARAHRPPPAVTIVELRRAYVPTDPTEPDPDAPHERQRYRNFRRVVQGHWRQQPHGPSRSLRRLQFIPAFVKGPDGAPLLVSERVNVWRR